MKEHWNKSEALDKKLTLAYASHFKAAVPTLIIFETIPGWMGVLGSPKGLKQAVLPRESRKAVLQEIKGTYNLTVNNDTSCLGGLPQRLKDYFTGKKVEFSRKLDLESATDFQIRVWEAILEIPYGNTESYRWVANKIGCTGGERAVGQALGKNPVPILVPCHRIIASNGKLGGFSGGLEMKKYLLNLEGVSVN